MMTVLETERPILRPWKVGDVWRDEAIRRITREEREAKVANAQ